MVINPNTKIASILKEKPEALDAIISLSPRFEKLRNPVMRRLMAGRTSLSMASKLGGCQVVDFYNTLKPLGFVIDENYALQTGQPNPLPGFLKSLKKEDILEFDVRPILQAGTDPLQQILERIKSVQPGQALKIINTFEPTPLMLLLQKKGYETFTDELSKDLFETYFYKQSEVVSEKAAAKTGDSDWDALVRKYERQTTGIDVRFLEMPQPMMRILEALEKMNTNEALYVYHKRVPVFLLPELNDRNFEYRIKEVSDGEVHMLIFKN